MNHLNNHRIIFLGLVSGFLLYALLNWLLPALFER